MYFLRGNLSNITYEELNYTDYDYEYDDDYEEILSWAEWFASWFWF
jgi:hypothetical protein